MTFHGERHMPDLKRYPFKTFTNHVDDRELCVFINEMMFKMPKNWNVQNIFQTQVKILFFRNFWKIKFIFFKYKTALKQSYQ